jgi:hypothetical protein
MNPPITASQAVLAAGDVFRQLGESDAVEM